jgi:hypothetical protein
MNIQERIDTARTVLYAEIRRQGAELVLPERPESPVINGAIVPIDFGETKARGYRGTGNIRCTFGPYGTKAWVGVDKDGSFKDLAGTAARIIKVANNEKAKNDKRMAKRLATQASQALVEEIRGRIPSSRAYDVQSCAKADVVHLDTRANMTPAQAMAFVQALSDISYNGKLEIRIAARATPRAAEKIVMARVAAEGVGNE